MRDSGKTILRVIAALIILNLSSFSCFAQDFNVELSGGTSILVGWWIHNKGSDDVSVENDRSYDRTHASPLIPLEGKLNLRYKRYHLFFSGGLAFLMEDEMTGSRHSESFYNIIPVADKSVKLWFSGGGISYSLISKHSFRMAPFIQAGYFDIKTLYPNKAELLNRWYLGFGVDLRTRLKGPLWLDLGFEHRGFHMSPNDGEYENESHTISGVGVKIGLSLDLIPDRQNKEDEK